MSVMEEQRARSRRSFTDEFKADAVAMVIDDGNTIADVADRLMPQPDRDLIGILRTDHRRHPRHPHGGAPLARVNSFGHLPGQVVDHLHIRAFWVKESGQ